MTRVLVVDDSSVIRKVARRILEGLSIETDEAESGQAALDACAAGMPDGVLLDWNMPEMDGYAVLAALRKMPGGSTPKVVFCTTENCGLHIVVKLMGQLLCCLLIRLGHACGKLLHLPQLLDTGASCGQDSS